MSAAERQAYLRRFTADMARLQAQRDAEHRRTDQVARQRSATETAAEPAPTGPEVIPGWNGTPPSAQLKPAFEYGPGPPAFEAEQWPSYTAPAAIHIGEGVPDGFVNRATQGFTNTATGRSAGGPIYRQSNGTAYTYSNRQARPQRSYQPDPNRTVYITETGERHHAAGCQHLRLSQIPIRWRNAHETLGACLDCGGG